MNQTIRPRLMALPAITVLLALLPMLAASQAIYRIVGPDGRVTFSDKPPTANERATALGPGGRSSTEPSSVDIPFELRQSMNRYPVTLYTGDDCSPCDAGRALLISRGVPHSEKTIKTPKDAEALKSISKEESLPILTIGGQVLKGFGSLEWGQYLDAAGYPKTSQLPRSYRNPPASPLVPLAETPVPQPDAATSPIEPATPAVPPSPGPTPSNPAGIVF